MSYLAWNCRGLGNSLIVPILKKEVFSKAPKFMFLCEIKLFVREFRVVASRLGFQHCLGVDCVLLVGVVGVV